MPSSHSSSVMGLACAVAFQEGTASPLFAACLVFAVVVMYDASGVRLQAGRQAEVLNQIVYELPPDHPLAESRPLKEPIGHTQPQVVAGALLLCLILASSYCFVTVVPDVEALGRSRICGIATRYAARRASRLAAFRPSHSRRCPQQFPQRAQFATYPPSCVPVHRSPPLSTPAVPCRRPAVAWRMEELQPPSERVLFHFARAGARGEEGATQGAMDAWHVYSDAIYGGETVCSWVRRAQDPQVPLSFSPPPLNFPTCRPSGSSTATLAHATSGSAEPAGSGTELPGMCRDQGRGDMMGRDRMDGSAGMVLPPHAPTQHGWEVRAMRLQQHLHFEPPSSFAVFAGSLSRRVQGKEQGEGVEGGGRGGAGRLLKGGFAGIRTIEGLPTFSLWRMQPAATSSTSSLEAFSPLLLPLPLPVPSSHSLASLLHLPPPLPLPSASSPSMPGACSVPPPPRRLLLDAAAPHVMMISRCSFSPLPILPPHRSPNPPSQAHAECRHDLDAFSSLHLLVPWSHPLSSPHHLSHPCVPTSTHPLRPSQGHAECRHDLDAFSSLLLLVCGGDLLLLSTKYSPRPCPPLPPRSPQAHAACRHDLDAFSSLHLLVRGDGRTYLST
ncbi:unnamed protein product [Closterium sp. Naga37s-1]|nr:unnamed protein product [Closterium sp. Naga37s-1]